MASTGDAREKHAQQLKKTQMCKFFPSGRCGKGSDCSFAHYGSEIRERPDLNRTSMCKAFLTHGICTNRHCTFAHDERELRATEGFFKTKLCKFADSGRCKHGKSCRFAHNAQELGPQRVEQPLQAPSLWAAPPMPASFVTPGSSPLSAISGVPDPFGEAVQVLQTLQVLQELQGQLAMAEAQRAVQTDGTSTRTGTYVRSSEMSGSSVDSVDSGGDEDTTKDGMTTSATRSCTTLMLVNVPKFLTQGAFLSLLEDLSPAMRNAFDFFYVPWDGSQEQNLGYAIINFTKRSAAVDFEEKWSGQPFPGLSKKEPLLRVLPAALQGRAANLRHFSGFSLAQEAEPRFRPLVRAMPEDQLLPMARAQEMASNDTGYVMPLPPGFADTDVTSFTF